MRPRTIIAVIGTAALVGGILAWREYGRGHVDTAHREPLAKVTATELLAAFVADEPGATSRFVGTTEQVVQVSGAIRAIEPVSEGMTNIILETGDDLAGVVCEFSPGDVPPSWAPGSNVSVKGVCTGMLLDVVLVRCAAAE